MISDRKTQANGENSQRSTGPTSAKGKDRSRLNAIKSGLFSKESVIVASGEKPEDFDRFRSLLWNQFQPQDAVKALLVEDFVTTWWRLQRPRRYETAEIRRRLDTAVYRRHYEQISEVDALKGSFIRDYVALHSASTGEAGRRELSCSLERIRRRLEEKSFGLMFLASLLKQIAAQARDRGQISESNEKMLLACCGLADEDAKSCVMLNMVAKKLIEKMNEGASAAKTSFKLNKQMLGLRLNSKIQTLEAREKVLQKLESVEESAHLSSLLMPPAECSDRIHRAEAALERRLFKTLDRLLAMQGVELPG